MKFSVCAPSGCSTREQLDRGRFFGGLQNYMHNKNEANENKKMLGDFNCTRDKIDRDEDLWRTENPHSPEFTCYDRSFAKDPG